MKPTEQKAREAAEALYPTGVGNYCYPTEEQNQAAKERDWGAIAKIIASHFADEPKQPSKSLDGIVEDASSRCLGMRSKCEFNPIIRQACIEYAAQLAEAQTK